MPVPHAYASYRIFSCRPIVKTSDVMEILKQPRIEADHCREDSVQPCTVMSFSDSLFFKFIFIVSLPSPPLSLSVCIARGSLTASIKINIIRNVSLVRTITFVVTPCFRLRIRLNKFHGVLTSVRMNKSDFKCLTPRLLCTRLINELSTRLPCHQVVMCRPGDV